MGLLNCVITYSSKSRFEITSESIWNSIIPISKTFSYLSWSIHSWICPFLFHYSKMTISTLIFWTKAIIEFSFKRIHKLSISNRFITVIPQPIIIYTTYSSIVSKIFLLSCKIRSWILIKFHIFIINYN